MPLKILITGGAGFIGSNLIRQAIASRSSVLNVDCLTYAGNLDSLTDIADDPNYQFANIDITDGRAIQATLVGFEPDVVMHLAAESHVDRSIDGPGEFIQTNVVGTFNVLQASLKHWRSLSPTAAAKFRVLHVSTDEVYGSLGGTGYFTETTAYDPHSPYSASKASSDHLARAWHETYGLPVIVTHCGNNYGPYQFPEKLIPLVILKCLRGELIPVYGRGENIRDWLYVDDHCRALRIVVGEGTPGETYNIGGNSELKNIDLVRLICEILGELAPPRLRASVRHYEELITFVADRPGHDFRYAIDASKIKRDLGWQATTNIHAGIRETVQWYLDHQNWWQAILSGKYRLTRVGAP